MLQMWYDIAIPHDSGNMCYYVTEVHIGNYWYQVNYSQKCIWSGFVRTDQLKGKWLDFSPCNPIWFIVSPEVIWQRCIVTLLPKIFASDNYWSEMWTQISTQRDTGSNIHFVKIRYINKARHTANIIVLLHNNELALMINISDFMVRRKWRTTILIITKREYGIVQHFGRRDEGKNYLDWSVFSQ